jgi:hypothetical protein
MKINLVTLLIVASTCGGIASFLAQAEDPPKPLVTKPDAGAPETTGPKIEFATPIFDFGKISGGESVRHDFVFTNTGTALLEITDVRPSCGCTTAGTWDREVKPGKTGVIPLQFNSANADGKVTKMATVTCNDPGRSNVVLQITGTVWRPIEITPQMAIFKVSEDIQTNETKVVRIVNHLEKPLTLSDLQSTNEAFKAELKTVKPGEEFELHITAVAPFMGRSINSQVTLKTSSPTMPTINVGAYLMVEQAVVITPNVIALPAGALAASMNRSIMIRNNGTNALALSDASVNIPGAEVRLKETQPGRMFNLTVDFPAGFQVKPDQKFEVTLKSNHPKFALITVPVFQPKASVPPVATPLESVGPAKPELPRATGK